MTSNVFSSLPAFYDHLQNLLQEAGFHAFAEEVCKPFHAGRMGAAASTYEYRIPRRLLGLGELVEHVCDRAVAAKIADAKKLRPTHYWHGAGRYIRIGAASAWVGIDHRLFLNRELTHVRTSPHWPARGHRSD
jgi:hypothetical protein